MHKLLRKSLMVFLALIGFVAGIMLLPAFVQADDVTVEGKPRFTVTVSDDWTKQTPKSKSDKLIYAAPAGDKGVYLSIYDITEGMKLEDHAKNYGAGMDGYEIISNKPFELEDGTKAYFTEVEYLWGGSSEVTAGVMSAFKDGKWVCVHLWTMGALEDEEMEILESLVFE